VDLVHHNSVSPGDEIVLKPAPGYPGRDYDDVPARCLRRRLPLPIDHAGVKRLPQNGLGNRTDSQCLAGPRPGHNPEGKALPSPFAQFLTVLALEKGVYLQLQRQLNRLARRPGGSDDDDAPLGVGSEAIGVGIGREMMVARWMHR